MRSAPIGTAGGLSILLSIAVVTLVSFAIAGPRGALFYAMLVSTTLAVMALRHLFPSARLLSITFIDLVAVYASVFALFVDEVFSDKERRRQRRRNPDET